MQSVTKSVTKSVTETVTETVTLIKRIRIYNKEFNIYFIIQEKQKLIFLLFSIEFFEFLKIREL